MIHGGRTRAPCLDEGTRQDTCSACQGTGTANVHHPELSSPLRRDLPCPSCNGRGFLLRARVCLRCGGEGEHLSISCQGYLD